ncbi:MAG: thermonuclease family protein [Chloroflexota bacterium]
MKSLITFWKKDIINKMIVLVSLALIAGVIGAIVLAAIFLPGNSAGFSFTDIFPARATATFDVNLYLTPRTATVSPYTRTPTPTVAVRLPETATLLPELQPPTSTLDATAEAVSAMTVAASILSPTIFVQPTSGAAPSATLPPTLPAAGAACIPPNATKTGRVVEVLDGNTLRVIIDGPTYVARYIGVGAPEHPAFAEAARLKNQELVYAKDVTLVPSVAPKDDRGRLLFYVLVGEKFINLEIIQQGLGLALDVPPNTECSPVFKAAQQQAMSAGLGMWMFPTATPGP